MRTQAAADDRQVLVITFDVSGSLFGMETSLVQEVVRLTAVTPVHDAASCVVGVMNLRGHISTVIDLSTRLGLGQFDPDGDKRIIIVEWSGERVGLVVDKMEDVLSVDPGIHRTRARKCALCAEPPHDGRVSLRGSHCGHA